jgi:hypothetical protein
MVEVEHQLTGVVQCYADVADLQPLLETKMYIGVNMYDIMCDS